MDACTVRWETDKFKLRRLGPTNRIIDHSDFKPSEFEQQNPSNLKSDIEIGFRLNDNVNFQLKSTNFQLKSMDFDLFSTIFVSDFWLKSETITKSFEILLKVDWIA